MELPQRNRARWAGDRYQSSWVAISVSGKLHSAGGRNLGGGGLIFPDISNQPPGEQGPRPARWALFSSLLVFSRKPATQSRSFTIRKGFGKQRRGKEICAGVHIADSKLFRISNFAPMGQNDHMKLRARRCGIRRDYF